MAVLNYHNFDTLGFTTGTEGPNQFYSGAQTASGYENIHIRTDSSNKFNGMDSLRVEIDQSLPRSGVWRSELRTQVYGGYPNVMEGFYAVAIKLGTTTVGEESAVISQLWDGTSGPSLSLQWGYSDNSIFARIHGGPSNVNFPLFTGDSTWHTVILYHHSLPNSSGKLKIWVDGTLTVNYTGRTSYATETDSTTPYWKLGLYDSGFDDDTLVSNRVIYLAGVNYHDATDTESDTLAWINNFWGSEPEPETYTIIANGSSGGTASGGGTFIDGATATLTATPNSGYQFVRWVQGGSTASTNNPYIFTVTGNRTLTAEFELIPPVEYDISVTVNGSGSVTGDGTYNEEQEVTLTATPSAGWLFDYWEDADGTYNDNPLVFVATADRDLTVYFVEEPPEPTQYTITVNVEGEGTVTGDGVYDEDDEVTLTATAETGWEFLHWSDTGGVYLDNPYVFSAESDRDLDAVFIEETPTPTEYTVTVTQTTGGVVAGGGIYEEGQEAELTAIPDSGWTFVKWSDDTTENPYVFEVTGNVALSAVFELVDPPEPTYITVKGKFRIV